MYSSKSSMLHIHWKSLNRSMLFSHPQWMISDYQAPVRTGDFWRWVNTPIHLSICCFNFEPKTQSAKHKSLSQHQWIHDRVIQWVPKYFKTSTSSKDFIIRSLLQLQHSDDPEPIIFFVSIRISELKHFFTLARNAKLEAQ